MKAFTIPSFCLFLFFSCVSPSSEEQAPPEEGEETPEAYVKQDLSVSTPGQKKQDQDNAPDPAQFRGGENKPSGQPASSDFRYNLLRADDALMLPNELKKISGLSMTVDGQQLIALNDGGATLFFLNKETGEILNKVEVKKRGNFQSVEAVQDGIFLSKTNGTLIQVTDLANEKPSTKSYHSFLSARNDVSGLAYDPVNNELLLACQGLAGPEDFQKTTRAVFVFQLNQQELFRQPMFQITGDAIAEYLGKQNVSERIVDVVAENYPAEAFAPSCIAVHPQTHNIYLLSSSGNLLIVLNRESQILHMETLESYLFSHPNGLCFDNNATLYISNFGGIEPGKIFRFFMREFQ